MHENPIAEFAQFRATFGGHPLKDLTPEYFDWKFNHCPGGPGYLHLTFDGPVPTSSAGLSTRFARFDGQSVLVAEIGDTYTDPNYRRQGLFSKSVTSCLEFAHAHGIELVYGTPNEASLAGYVNKLGFATVEPGYEHWILRAGASVEEGLVENVPRIAAAAISKGYGLLVKSRFRLAQMLAPGVRLGPKACAKSIDTFSVRRPGFGGPDYFFLRDNSHLTWRFLRSPQELDLRLVLSDGDCIGYVALHAPRGRTGGVGSIVDLVLQRESRRHATAALTLGTRALLRAGAGHVQLYTWPGSTLSRAAVRLGFSRIAVRPLIVFAGTELGQTLRSRADNLHFAMADCDAL